MQKKKLYLRILSLILTVSMLLSTVTIFAETYRGDSDSYEGSYDSIALDAFGIGTANLHLEPLTARTPVIPPNVGNQNFRDILTYFPELWDANNERTMPAFSMEHSNLIREVVWVEVPLDSLSTGNSIDHYNRDQRDLVAIRITRPREADPNHPHTGNEADASALVRLPALINQSPYRNNNILGLEWVQSMGHTWSEGRFMPSAPPAYGTAPWHPEVFYRSPSPVIGSPTNPITSGSHYNDIRWHGRTLDTWHWGDSAASDAFYNIPASRGERPRAMANYFPQGTFGGGVASGAAAANFGNFMFTRGFVTIDASMVGGRFSWPVGDQVEGPFNTGIGPTGEVGRHLSTVAIVAWLNGEARGFTCPAATHEVVAYWANGDAIMTGTSYGGTAAYAAVSAGFTRSNADGYTLNALPRDGGGGLRAIYPVAGIANQYEYYRRNASDLSPFVYTTPEPLGRSTQDIWYNLHMQPGSLDRDAVEHIFQNIVRPGQSFGHFNYNAWWDHNNSIRDLRSVVNAGVGILSQQGFNDNNVMITNNEATHWAMQQLGGYHKQILHLDGHTNAQGWYDGRVMEIIWAWNDYFVYGIDGIFQQEFYANHAPSGDARSLFDIETVTSCLTTGAARFYSQWPALPIDGYTGPAINPESGPGRFPLQSMRRFYLGQNPQETGGLLLATPNSTDELTFVDNDRHRAMSEPKGQRNPADPYFSASYGLVDAHANQAWINMPIWIAEAWYTEAWRNSMLFPTSTPLWNTAAGAQAGFPTYANDNTGVRVNAHVDINELLEHTDHRLTFVSEPLAGNVTLAGVPRITLEISSNQPIGNLSAMIVDIGPPASRAMSQVANPASAGTIPGTPGILSNWGNRWGYQVNNAAVAAQRAAHIVSRSGTSLQNPNPPERPIVLPDGTVIPGRASNQPGVTYIDTPITINTGMYAPFAWQTTDIQPGEFYSYTFTLEPAHYTFREGNRLAVVVYPTHEHQTRSAVPAELTLRMGEGSFIYLPLLTALDISSDSDVTDAAEFLSNHIEALELALDTIAPDTIDLDALSSLSYVADTYECEYVCAHECDYYYNYECAYICEYVCDSDLSLAVPNLDATDESAHAGLVNAAIAAYNGLNVGARLLLADERAHLGRLLALLGQTDDVIEEVQEFLDDHAEILGHDVLSIGWYDDWRLGWHDVSVNGDILAGNYIHLLVNNDAVLGVVNANITLLQAALGDFADLDPAARAFLNYEQQLLQDLYNRARAVQFNAAYHDVLWMHPDQGSAGSNPAWYRARPHVHSENYATVLPRANAAVSAWNALPVASRNLMGPAAGHVRYNHQMHAGTRLTGIVARAQRASADIHSFINITNVTGRTGTPGTFIAQYGQYPTAPNEIRIFQPAALGGSGTTATVAISVPYEQTTITPANINILSGATFQMFSDANFSVPTSSTALSVGVTPVRIRVEGTHQTINYTINVTRLNNNAVLNTFAGQAVNAAAEADPGIYCPIRREYITTLYTAAITVPTTVDAIRGVNPVAIAGINTNAATATNLSAGAAARIFAAPSSGVPAFTSEIVGSRYIPLVPGVPTPVYVRVRSQAFSLAPGAGYNTVNYYRIMVTRERPTLEIGGVQTTMVEVTSTATADNFVSIFETGRNTRIWALTFNVSGLDRNGDAVSYRHVALLPGPNPNLRGTYVADGVFTLNYDIRNNGANVALFEIVPK